jgi:hypothetical protein
MVLADFSEMDLPSFGMQEFCDTATEFWDSAIGSSSTAALSFWEDETLLYAKMLQEHKTP